MWHQIRITAAFKKTTSSCLFLCLHFFFLLLNPSVPFASAQDSETRTWRDQTGKFSVEAKRVSHTKSKVKLVTSDGKTIDVPIAKLSDEDRNYLNSIETSSDSPKNDTPRIDLADTQQSIKATLDGPPLPASSLTLNKLTKQLTCPTFIDLKALEEVGIDGDIKIKLTAGHQTLGKQLDAALSEQDLSWRALNTVLTISQRDRRRTELETRIYQIPTPRNDFTAVIRQLHEIEERSWEALGGDGRVVGMGAYYAISQVPEVHRKIAEALRRDPVPIVYEHPLDSIGVSVSVAPGSTTIETLAKQLNQQIDWKIVVSSELDPHNLHYNLPEMSLKNVSVKDVLDLTMSQMDCVWLEKDEKIIIEMENRSSPKMTRNVFPLKIGTKFIARQIPEAILTCISPNSWKGYRGKGTIKAVRRGFQVEQSEPVMREVEQFLNTIRALQ